MANEIVRGSNCRICFYPQGGLRVADLGDPVIGIRQELAFLLPDVVVDEDNNRIYADLTEYDTMQLVEGVTTEAQAAFTNDDGEVVYRFPVHQLTVSPTIFGIFFETIEEEEEEEDSEE